MCLLLQPWKLVLKNTKKQEFGYYKTKKVFLADEGLVEKQAPFLTVARPIALTLDRLEEPPNIEDG